MINRTSQVGFIRDRTTQFRNFRNLTNNGKPGGMNIETNLIGAAAMGEARMRGDVSVIQEANSIDSMFNSIENDIKTLTDMHKARLRASFNDNKTQDAQIEAKTQAIASQIASVRDMIRNPINARTAAARTIEENMRKGFASKLRDVTLHFREIQGSFIQSIRKQNDKLSTDKGEDDELMLDDLDPGFTGDQTSIIMANDLMLRQRNQELQGMVQMMNQLNQLFSDLGTLIIEQGTVLDRIDGIIEKSIDEIRSGNSELEKANKDQQSKCFYYYISIVLILILLFGTIIILRKGKSKSS